MLWGNKRTRAAADRVPPGAGLGADQVPSGAHLEVLTLSPRSPLPVPSLRTPFKTRGTEAPAAALPGTHPSRGFFFVCRVRSHTHEHTQVYPHHNSEIWEIAEQNPGFRRVVVYKVRRAQPEFQPEPRLPEPARDSELVALRFLHREILIVGTSGGRPRFPSGASAQWRGAGVQGKEPGLWLCFLSFKDSPAVWRGPEGAGGRRALESGGGRFERVNNPWPREMGVFIYFVPVRLVVKFLERCRQWGGLRRGRFGEIRGRGGRRDRAGAQTRVLLEARGALRAARGSAARGISPGVQPLPLPLPTRSRESLRCVEGTDDLVLSAAIVLSCVQVLNLCSEGAL